MSRPGERRKSWFLLKVGCALVGVVTLGAVVALGIFGVNGMRKVRAELRDGDRREATALRLLGAERLPVGYRVEQNLPLWPLAEMVLLSAGDPAVGETGFFIYVKTRQENVHDDPAALLEKHGFHELPGVFSGYGTVATTGGGVIYSVRRGRFVTDDGRSIDPAWIAELEIDCHGDKQARFALWATAAEAGAPAAEGEVARAPATDGTPADPLVIEAFLSSFTLCER